MDAIEIYEGIIIGAIGAIILILVNYLRRRYKIQRWQGYENGGELVAKGN